MRGDQLARQWRIVRSLESARKGLTINDLAQQEEVSFNTISRDLDALHEAGFPIYWEDTKPAKRWFFVDDYRLKVPPPFSLSELLSLWVYRDFLQAFQGTTFYEALDSLFKKVQLCLSPEMTAYLDRCRSTFSVGIKPYRDYGRLREIINQVNRAALEGRRIEVAYHSLRSDRESTRKLDPYQVWFHQGTIYLIAHCHARGEVRMFVLDRMRLVRVTDESFQVPTGFDLGVYLQHCFGVMRGRETHRVRVYVPDPAWARYIGEKTWHQSQEVAEHPDGGIVLGFQVADLGEVQRWVMSFGSQAVVLEPAELRAAVVAQAEEMLKAHQNQDAQEGTRRDHRG